MGMFVYLRGKFECVRCGRISDGRIQTKLLRSEADNCSREYRAGDSEVLAGLDDYYPLHPWDDCSPLIVAVGDWECAHCRLNWQWARVILDVGKVNGGMVVTVREVSGLLPRRAADLDGVHFTERELAELSESDVPLLGSDPPGWLMRWQEWPVSERCERVAAGFRAWCHVVAGVEILS